VTTAFAAILFRWRRVLATGVVLGAIILAPRANITRIDNDLTAWFSRNDPIYQDYERFQAEFGGTRTLVVAIQAKGREHLFSRDGLAALADITRAIERVQTVSRVNSLATATVVAAAAGADESGAVPLDVRPLIDENTIEDPADVATRAIGDELLRGDLVSEDGSTAAVIVFFDEQRVDAVRSAVLEEIKAIVQGRLPPDFRSYFNGSLEISEEYNRVTLANQAIFTPPIFVLTLAALFLMFRSWRVTLVTMCAVLLSVVWTLGLYDLLGFSFNVLSSMIVPLVVVLAIADDVHIVQHYMERRREGSAEHAFVSSVSHLVAPLVGASGTTALGMLSLATSNVVAVRQFGIGSAVGVMVDLAISLVFLPTVLGLLKPGAAPAPQESWFAAPMRRVARFAIRRAWLVIAVTAAIAAAAMAGVSRLRVDTNHINFFSPQHPLGESARVIDTKLGGIYTFQILLEGPPDALSTPAVLGRMDRLEEDLRRLPFVRKVTGLADYVKRVHRELGDGTGPAIPDDSRVIAQELFVFSLADAGRVELDRVVASDLSTAQITVKLASMSSDLVFAQVSEAERLAADAFTGTHVRPTVTGSGRLFSTLDHYLVLSQISSFTTAFVTVFAVIFLVFRSWRFGLLAIVPNLVPVITVFGLMGWIGISLNVATIMLASVALGIVDDDTIHFISRYRRETAAGETTGDAIETALAHEGRASLTTALINSASFAVLALSSYKPTAWFGGLLALTMGVAFLAEAFILPAIITVMPRLFGSARVHGVRLGAAGGVR
jgi:predicted RND superfamily exporter protein